MKGGVGGHGGVDMLHGWEGPGAGFCILTVMISSSVHQPSPLFTEKSTEAQRDGEFARGDQSPRTEALPW